MLHVAVKFWSLILCILSVPLMVLHHPHKLSEALDRRATVTRDIFSPCLFVKGSELQLQAGSCLWGFPLCLVWALESIWLQITLIWNMKQKIKMIQKPLSSDVILDNCTWWNISSFPSMHTCPHVPIHTYTLSLHTSLYIYKFLTLHPHNGDKSLAQLGLWDVLWAQKGEVL